VHDKPNKLFTNEVIVTKDEQRTFGELLGVAVVAEDGVRIFII
jgi:hypothetical protein